MEVAFFGRVVLSHYLIEGRGILESVVILLIHFGATFMLLDTRIIGR